MTQSLSQSIDCPYIATQFSRLIIDANRDLQSDTLIRDEADGVPVEMNRNLTTEEVEFRINEFWLPYRCALDDMLMRYENLEYLISIHSFTPIYQGHMRTCEVGILCLEEDASFANEVLYNYDMMDSKY